MPLKGARCQERIIFFNKKNIKPLNYTHLERQTFLLYSIQVFKNKKCLRYSIVYAPSSRFIDIELETETFLV